MEPKYDVNSEQVTAVLIAGNDTQNCLTLNWVPKAVATAAEIRRLKNNRLPSTGDVLSRAHSPPTSP